MVRKLIAGFVLVAAFAVVGVVSTSTASAQTTAFTQTLTIGSTGPEVVALQTWLEARGYLVMPVGVAKGYFGSLTASAVAKYQAAKGITPAVGYFGPITRAAVNAEAGVVVNPGNPSNPSTGLQGGETSLEDYELSSEESSANEGESDVEVATAEFDVEDADARIERLEVDFQAEDNGGTPSVRPWDYFESVSVWADGKMLDEMDVDSRSDWDEDDDDTDHSASTADYYRLTFTGLDYVVNEGETAEITIAVNVASSIDSDDLAQEFTVLIPDEGIRATDSEGIQSYVGDFDETVGNFGFDEEESGDLTIQSSSEDPDAMTLVSDEDSESDEYTVFVFDVENDQEADSLITDLEIDVATTGATLANILDSATLVVDGDEHDGDINNTTGVISFDDIDVEVAGDDEVSFELVITLKEDAATSTTLVFSIDDLTAEGVDTGDDSDVSGSATSEEHSIESEGLIVNDVTMSTDTTGTDDTVGKYTFTVEVESFEEDAWIELSATQGTSESNTGFNVLILDSSTNTATTAGSATFDISASEDESNDNRVEVADGADTVTFTVTVFYDAATAGTYKAQLYSINFADSDADASEQFLLTPEASYRTGSEFVAQ